ncbi:MAG: choice-of-anchor tandem repeat GloVer-containing protein [Thermosynechococcaceae cyanobacterium]
MQTVFRASAIALLTFTTLAPLATAQPTLPTPLQRPIIKQPLRSKLPHQPRRRVQTQAASITEWPLTDIGAALPYGTLVRAKNGNFYGVTRYGIAFKMTPTGTLTKWATLKGHPSAGLVQGIDGNFYGTTADGGSLSLCNGFGCGTVFRITPAGKLTTLVKFDGYTTGRSPSSRLIQASDGNFYGTTSYGSSGGAGTIFRMTPTGQLTTIVRFDGTNGSEPYAGLIQGSDGNFYGTTVYGGPDSCGTVFRMTPAGDLATLANFTTATGCNLYASLIQAKNGYFYGTTYQGGTYGGGTVFRISAAGVLTTLVHFGSGGATGMNPTAELLQAKDGNFYGTTPFGGFGLAGTVFKMTPQGSVTTLFEFPGGGVPEGGLVQANGGFYGIEYFGNSVFKLVP